MNPALGDGLRGVLRDDDPPRTARYGATRTIRAPKFIDKRSPIFSYHVFALARACCFPQSFTHHRPSVTVIAMKSANVLPWDLASLVDLELAVTQETGLDDAQLKSRDRAFYQSYGGDRAAGGSRSRVLRAWVEERRRESDREIPTPGQEAGTCLGWIKALGSLATFGLGGCWAWGALTLHGAPVNVLTFWILTIGMPFLLTLAGFYLLLGRRLPHVPQAPFFLKRLLANLLVGGVLRTEHHFTARIGSARESALRARAGELRARFSDRRGLLACLLSNTLHGLGLGMVLGIFAALFALKNFSNQDYGWQSDAACVTPARVEGLVGVIARPWTAVFGRDAGHPTTQQIARTRFFRNEGVTGVDHSASINWSSFLVLSSLFWGVLPRVVLCVIGRVSTSRQLAREDFSQHRFDALWRRMTKPDLTMEPAAAGARGNPPRPVPASAQPRLTGTGLLLMPQELASDALKRNVLHGCQVQYGGGPRDSRVMPSLPTARAALLDELAMLPEAKQMELHILQESFMPPVKEFRAFLRDCRAKLGAGAAIRVILIGERTGDGTWNGPSDQERAVWNDKIAAIGDPRISILTLEPATDH